MFKKANRHSYLYSLSLNLTAISNEQQTTQENLTIQESNLIWGNNEAAKFKIIDSF